MPRSTPFTGTDDNRASRWNFAIASRSLPAASALAPRSRSISPGAGWTSRSRTTVPARSRGCRGRRARRRTTGRLIQANLSHGAECQAAGRRGRRSLGRLDVLINMASVYPSVPFDQTDEAAWDAVVDVDLKAAFLCAHAAVPHLRAAGAAGSSTSATGSRPAGGPRYKGYIPYYVAKRGVIGLTEALALELAGDQILVNAVAPGSDPRAARHDG